MKWWSGTIFQGWSSVMFLASSVWFPQPSYEVDLPVCCHKGCNSVLCSSSDSVLSSENLNISLCVQSSSGSCQISRLPVTHPAGGLCFRDPNPKPQPHGRLSEVSMCVVRSLQAGHHQPLLTALMEPHHAGQEEELHQLQLIRRGYLSDGK